ncbi:MAG TPA: lysophospholipid acyltransferase family protein [Bacteroidales bacterium]|nr:lysophospholipid acyltransferase family protein [Bacteroidales bacterium]HPT20500.1 lysophospholipid acyltransferase family protein [Bacteroidales bacterium]
MDIIKSMIVWFSGIVILAVLFPLTFIIWLVVLPFDKERMVIHWMLIGQGIILSRLMPIWKISIEGREKAVKGTTYVMISNHQSILDTILLTCLRYRFKWISKIENLKVPVLGWYLGMAGYIIVDRDNEKSKETMLADSYNCLKKGISLMIFPEGTRSRDNQIGVFKRGAFELAIKANVPILPILIDGTGGVLPKHGVVFSSGHHLKIKVLDPVQPDSFDTENPYDLAIKIQALMRSEQERLN